MSIFDKDIQHPIEHLYDECKDVCENIVPSNIIPGNTMHYNGICKTMQRDIILELMQRDLFVEQFVYKPDGLNKICRVEVQLGGYIRLIPHYRVWFYYNSKDVLGSYGYHHFQQSYLTDFIVGVNGVEGNRSM